jgi:UDP-N-acetylglucosamine 2-epimerase (non-hydrolysing)
VKVVTQKILHIVGARPNFVKVAPVIDALSRRLPAASQVVVHTGQHYDYEMSRQFFVDLGMRRPDYDLGVGSAAHAAQTGRILERVGPVLEQEQPDAVVVAGDVNSTLAGALAAVKLGIPVAHVEAGLRSFDRTMPEEINRVLTDQVSRWCLTHSPEARANLLREGIDESRITFVGNTMIDSLVRLAPLAEQSTILERLRAASRTYALVTLHRPNLVDGPLLARAVEALVALSRELPIVFPVHPRTRGRLGPIPASSQLHLVEPLGYLDFLALEARAAAVITDSGGIQEETTFLGVPCFTLRDRTERPITVTQGTNQLLGLDVERILEVPAMLRNAQRPIAPPEGWDGAAAERIVDVLLRDLSTLAEPGSARSAVESEG